MSEYLNRIIQGDCLVESDKIASGSVDLILTDLPYGNMQGGPSKGNEHLVEIREWDFAICPADIYEVANRILRKNGKMVLFSQEPYTSRLITESIPELSFSYRMMWEKDNFANALLVNKAPVGFFEDIVVFSKRGDFEYGGGNNYNPLKNVFNKALEDCGKDKKFFMDLVGSSASHYFTKGIQFRIPTREKFEILNPYLKIDYSFEELDALDKLYKEEASFFYEKKFPSVFNLWEGGKYKSNILRYKKDYDGFHPTQKPVLLLEDLIKTFSNEGDLVVDLTTGSGSTCVAAINTGRSFIGIERDEEYVKIARQRVADAMLAKKGGK